MSGEMKLLEVLDREFESKERCLVEDLDILQVTNTCTVVKALMYSKTKNVQNERYS